MTTLKDGSKLNPGTYMTRLQAAIAERELHAWSDRSTRLLIARAKRAWLREKRAHRDYCDSFTY